MYCMEKEHHLLPGDQAWKTKQVGSNEVRPGTYRKSVYPIRLFKNSVNGSFSFKGLLIMSLSG